MKARSNAVAVTKKVMTYKPLRTPHYGPLTLTPTIKHSQSLPTPDSQHDFPSPPNTHAQPSVHECVSHGILPDHNPDSQNDFPSQPNTHDRPSFHESISHDIPTDPVPTTKVPHANIPTTHTTGVALQANSTLQVAIDSGSSGNYFPYQYLTNESTLLTNFAPTNNPTRIQLPNGSTIASTHTADLAIPNTTLPPTTKQAHIFPDLGETALLSLGLLCDAGCEATFQKDKCKVVHNGQQVLTGSRCHATGLWYADPIHLPSAFKTTTTNAATPETLVAFAHASFFSPTIAALSKALASNFILNFPGLTTTTLKKYPPHSVATAKGHMKQTRQGIQSTKQPSKPLPLLPEEIEPPTQEPDNVRSYACFSAVHEISGRTYSDQTGRFAIPSSQGANYVFILYDYDSNSIHADQ